MVSSRSSSPSWSWSCIRRRRRTSTALRPLVPVFISYVLSFVYLGIYWNNHHHLLQAAKVVDGRALWANMFLLFWLSLVPFATAWMGEGGFAPVPTALYGVRAPRGRPARTRCW